MFLVLFSLTPFITYDIMILVKLHYRRGEDLMKKNIQPELKLVTARCTCGAEHTFWSTKENIKLDVCSNCHPYYQGGSGSLIMDSEGRVQKFKSKYGDKY